MEYCQSHKTLVCYFFQLIDTGFSFKVLGFNLTYLESFDINQGILHGIVNPTEHCYESE